MVTLIVPTYNAAPTVGRALESIRRQSYRPLEVIVMDGLSSDDTLRVVEGFPDVVTRVVTQRDRGQAHALNEGFKIARGEIAAWLCADDELMPESVQHAVNHFQAEPSVDVLAGGCLRCFADGSQQVVIPPANAFEILGLQFRIEQPSTFWRREAMGEDLRLDESLNYTFDWDFFARLARKARRVLVLPDIMSVYHFSPKNKTSTGGRKLVLEMREVIRRHGPLDGRMADVFYFLYRNFDLAGCYDTPPSCTEAVSRRFSRVLGQLEKKYLREWLHMYNWNFASKQERQLVWYR